MPHFIKFDFSEVLSTESPKYILQIENQDNLARLSKKERLILCASILSSFVYQQDNLEVSLEWIRRTYRNEGAVNFEEKTISFKSAGNTDVTMKTECFLCKGFKNGENINSESTNLYVTRTYEDGYSAMVLKEQINGTISPDKYFKNIALLITAQKKIYYDELSLNFPIEH